MIKRMLAAMALTVIGSLPALSFEAPIDELIGRYKREKLVGVDDLMELMRQSERWCYAENAGQCDWSDVYLDVGVFRARMEISNAWSETVDISIIEEGAFTRNGNRLCEMPSDAALTVHARRRADGVAIGGRELQAIKDELAAKRDQTVVDCFDYLYLSSDATAQTVTLLQRQYSDDQYRSDADVTVTLHFDPASAQSLTLRW